MDIAYVDESGNSGYNGSHTYTLGCVIVRAEAWPVVFDNLIEFRRFIRTNFGIRVRDEIKANYLVRNAGTLKNLNLGNGQRRRIFRMHLRLAAKIGVEAFAVVIVKERINKKTMEPRDIAYEWLLNRLERRSTKSQVPILLNHDEGEAAIVRKLARKARRAGTAGSAFGTGYLQTPARLLVDDPVPRRSDQSYFIQLADLAAYAAFRHVIPPSAKLASVCPSTMWDELGTARIAAVNSVVGGHPGIVVWSR